MNNILSFTISFMVEVINIWEIYTLTSPKESRRYFSTDKAMNC